MHILHSIQLILKDKLKCGFRYKIFVIRCQISVGKHVPCKRGSHHWQHCLNHSGLSFCCDVYIFSSHYGLWYIHFWRLEFTYSLKFLYICIRIFRGGRGGTNLRNSQVGRRRMVACLNPFCTANLIINLKLRFKEINFFSINNFFSHFFCPRKQWRYLI